MSRIPRPYVVVALVFGSSLLACAQLEPLSGGADQSAPASAPAMESLDDAGYGGMAEGAKQEEKARPKKSARRARATGNRGLVMDAEMGAAPAPPPEPEAVAVPTDGVKGDEGGAPTRAWFPETFLFEPEVVTGKDGRAEVVAKVPDRLTTWRVLGLAHDRAGHQAGDVVEFTSSLPLYADPVVPAKLRVGDRARLAIPVVNTTGSDRAVQVAVQARGLDVRGGGGLRLPAYGSGVAKAEVVAVQPGAAVVHADINEGGVTQDAVEHTIPIIPTGRRHATTRTGTLGSPRTVDLPLPDGADAASAEARLTVVPGGLGVVQAEVASAGLRTHGSQGAAVLLQLASIAPRLWESAGLPVSEDGEEADARARWEQVRKLRLLGVQRAAQAQGDLPLSDAITLTAAASAHAGDPLIDAIAQRGLMALERHRHPDGTFGGSSNRDGNWTVQRMLVATGAAVDAVRAVGDTTTDDALKRAVLPHIVLGTGAAERFAGRVVDAYTASALLAAGLVEGDAKDRMLGIVRESLQRDEGGAWVELPEGVVRIDGRTPGRAETAALAARALAREGTDEDVDHIADLGATVLSSFRTGWGWGDLTTDYGCLRAVAELWSDAPSESVTLTLARGGQTLASRTLAADDLRDPVFMAVPAEGTGAWSITADPAVPGLAYGLELVSYTPWTDPPRDPGLDVEVRPPKSPRLGQTHTLSVDIAAPRAAALQLDIALPAGVQVDKDAILVRDGDQPRTPIELRTSDGEVHVELAAVQSGRLRVEVPVSPTIAGTLWSGSVEVSDTRGGALTIVPPTAWTIAGG